MSEYHPEYIIDSNSKRKAIILPYPEWRQILEDIEELADIRAYDKKKLKNDEIISFDKAVQEIKDGKVN